MSDSNDGDTKVTSGENNPAENPDVPSEEVNNGSSPPTKVTGDSQKSGGSTSFWSSFWPWSRAVSQPPQEEPSTSGARKEATPVPTPFVNASTDPAGEQSTPSSSPVPPTPQPPEEKPHKKSGLPWPWSSANQTSTTAAEDNKSKSDIGPPPSERQKSKVFSNKMAEFATKTLPETILGLMPWATSGKEVQVDNDTSITQHKAVDKLSDFHLSMPPKHKGLFSSWKSKAELETPWKDKPKVTPKRRPRLDEDGLITLRPVASRINTQDRFLEEFYIPENLAADVRLPKSPESNWNTAFHYLASLAAGDERYDSRKVRVFRQKWDFGDWSSSESSEGSTMPSTVNLTSLIPDGRRSTPYMYSHRPFRMPKLATQEEVQGSEMEPPKKPFDPIQINPTDWPAAEEGSETNLVATKWAFPEPIRADKQLLPEIDPLVRYKFQKLGKNRVTPEELVSTQKMLELGLSPSGRKLDEYCSGSEDECVYRRIMCKDDPEFDVLEPYVETESGDKWPNPFLFYWNWKRTTDENANDSYLLQERNNKDDDINERRRIAWELDSDPLKIPYQNLGADDTDYEDPLGPFSYTPVKVVLDKFQNWWKTYGGTTGRTYGELQQDPLSRRYPYVLNPQYSTMYQKYYQLKQGILSQRRKMSRIWRRMRGKYSSSCSRCCAYPVWFAVWKGSGRYLMRRVPRRWKFCKEQKLQTVFYATFSAVYATQYIAEYDLLPNMDDPVRISQQALENALRIQEKFCIPASSKSKEPFVDYIKMQSSESYKEYIECISLMCRFQPIKMPPRVRKAFFLNFFNVLSIQTQILRIPERPNTKYLWEIKDFWEKTKALVGFMELSLEEIYHGILRCNRIHPLKQVKVFEDENSVKGFPKEMCPTRLALDWMDPRIHFALSVGCKSCPPVLIFSLYEQDDQLNEVAKTFVRSRVTINLERRLVTLPMLFLWYERDFGSNKYVMLWYLKQFMVSKDMLKIRQLLTSGKSIRLRYEKLDQELDHSVRRHPQSDCKPAQQRPKIIPVYWGSKF